MGAKSSTINKKGYTKIGEIGKGGFGTVYKVKDKTTNELFAIKETLYLGEDGYDRAMKEVANGAALNHENVVKFNEYFVDRKENKLYITLELCDYNLSEWFESKMENRSYNEAIRMFREIACGIQYIHDHNIIHRDLKPPNVLIKNNVCKIADFGFAKREAGVTSVPGTPLYSSPEQVNGLWCDKSTDIFPLGLIFFEFFMKFNNNIEYFMIMSIIRRNKRMLPERFFERHKQTSPEKYKEAKELFSKMLEFVPSKRPTIQEVLNHPFSLPANQRAENVMTQQNNHRASDGKNVNTIAELMTLLQLIVEHKDTNKNKAVKSGSDASNKTVINAEKENSHEENSAALSSDSQRNALLSGASLQSKAKNMDRDVLNIVMRKKIATQINENPSGNSILSKLVILGIAKRNKILEMLDEHNTLILDNMKRVETLTKDLYNSLIGEIALSLQIIPEGKSIEELPENIKELLADLVIFIEREKKRIKELKHLENINRGIVEAVYDTKVHNKLCDNYNSKMLSIVTTISEESGYDSSKQESSDDITAEESLLKNLQRSSRREDLNTHLVSLVNYLKTKRFSSQNYIKILETVLMVSEKILNNRNGNLLLSISEALYLIVKNNKFKSNTDKGIIQRVITEALNLLHLKSEETQVTLFLLKTIKIFNIPEDVEFEYNRVVNIVIHTLDNENVDKSILETCFYLLYSLTHVSSKRHIIGDEIGMKTIVKKIRERVAQKADDHILRRAWSILISLSDENAVVCENFWKCDGLECFSECYALFHTNPKLIQEIFIVLANFSEFPQVRHLLIVDAYMKIFLNHLHYEAGDTMELSFTVAGILSHLLLVDREMWNRKVPNLRAEVQKQLNAAILRWNVKTERSISYNSFKPFQQILLCDQSPLESKYWVIWEFANLTYVNPSKYCPYLEEYSFLELIDNIAKSTQCPTNVRLLALTVLQQYENYKNND